MNILRMLFIPPKLDDYEQDKRVRFLHMTLWVAIIFACYIGILKVSTGSFAVARVVTSSAGNNV